MRDYLAVPSGSTIYGAHEAFMSPIQKNRRVREHCTVSETTMNRYEYIRHMLYAVYNIDHGLSEEEAISLYMRDAMRHKEQLFREL
jgi:hypothetical protein